LNPLYHHPRCHIPVCPLDSKPIKTENGEYRPERCIIYNQPFLSLLHYEPTYGKPNSTISLAELAGLQKTAQRLKAILTPTLLLPSFIPLRWPTPEAIEFTTHDPENAVHLLDPLLRQAETISLIRDYRTIQYIRCGHIPSCFLL
jgi:hypothetical protein